MILQDLFKDREIEVLRLLADGLSNREISERLFIGVETVKWYNKQIYSKLNVSGRKEAARKAEELGLLDEPQSVLYTKPKHNLRQQSTPFIGRSADIEHIHSLLSDEHIQLITILASGGMGKTRLSIAVAQSQLENYRDGIYFVPLAPLSSADDMVTTIAENIGLALHADNIHEQLVNFLKERSMLLVLDNFEHLLEGTVLVTDMFQNAEQIKIVVTSRERLNIRGEHVYNLSGLDFPTWETPEDALEYDSVKLFMQSAHRTRTDFELHADELDFLARICKLTEGMPLGLELAAGWIDVLSLEQIANEVQNGIDIFETDMRDIPERHRSLRATFERTWQRLKVSQRNIFMKLSVFRGGFTLEAAQIIANANPRDLRKLSQKALIQNDGNERYAIHELLRQFGARKLLETEELKSIQAKHAHFYADFMAAREQDMKNGRQLQGLTLIDPDFENVRLAWLYTVDQHQWGVLLKFRYSFYFYSNIRSRDHDALSLYEHALEILDTLENSSDVQLTRARIMAWSSICYLDPSLIDKVAGVLQEAISILEKFDDTSEDLNMAYHTNSNFANVHTEDRKSAQLGARKSQKIAQESGDAIWEGLASVFIALLSDNIIEEIDTLHHAKALCEATGDKLGLWVCYLGEMVILWQQDKFSEIEALMAYAETLIAPFNTASHLGITSRVRGIIAIIQDDNKRARYHFSLALQRLWVAGHIHDMYGILLRIAQAHVYDNNLKVATAIVLLLDDVSPYLRDINYLVDSRLNVQISYDELRSELEQKLKDEQAEHLWNEVQKPTLSDLVHELLNELDEV